MAYKKTSNLRIALPEKGVYYQKQGDTKNVYVYTYPYPNLPNPNGVRQIFIGRLDEKRNLLIPNNNYFNYFGKDESCCNKVHLDISIDPTTDIGASVSVGFKIMADNLVERYGLKKCLKEAFGLELTNQILQVAYYMASSKTDVIDGIDDYCKNHLGIKVNSRKCCDIFAAVECEDKKPFYESWFKTAVDKEKGHIVAYDVTSVSTYSKTNPDAEMGYNRDKEKLPQINIGLMTNISTGIPIYIDSYAGSLTDADNLIEFTEKAKQYGIDDYYIVMDGGFYDKDRIEYLCDNNFKFIIGMPLCLDQAKKVVDSTKGVDTFNNLQNYYGVYAKFSDIEVNAFNRKGKAIVLFDSSKRELQNTSSSETIEKIRQSLENKEKKKYETIIKEKKVNLYFDVIQNKDNKDYSFNYNENKAEEANKRNGFSVIYTNNFDITVKQVVDAYRMKDEDEKAFYDFKNSLNGYRLHTHGKKTTEGKVFVMFISLCIIRMIRKETSTYQKKMGLTLKRLIDKLESLTLSNIDKKLYKSEEVTKQLRDLFSSASIDLDDELKEYI